MIINCQADEPQPWRRKSRTYEMAKKIQIHVMDSSGKEHTGEYQVHGRPPVVIVWYKGESDRTQVGGSPPESIARQLLRELVRNQKTLE